MFVSKGAREKILSKRKAAFAENHVAPLLAEARSLGISKGISAPSVARSTGFLLSAFFGQVVHYLYN